MTPAALVIAPAPAPPGAQPTGLATALLRRTAAWAQRVAGDRARVVLGDAGDDPGNLAAIAEVVAAPSHGERVSAAASAAFERFGGPLLIVASDFPWLSAAHAAAALDDLGAGCDMTVGPSTAGDWYLLGLRASAAALAQLAPEAWTEGRLGAETLRAGTGAGLALGLLRSERPLRTRADAAALRADPLADRELIAALDEAGDTISGT